MFYIHETPTHFGLIIVSLILVLLWIIVSFNDTSQKDEKSVRNWLNFISMFFLLFTISILAIMIYQLPATATTEQLLPYLLRIWSSFTLYAFFAIFYGFTFDEWFEG